MRPTVADIQSAASGHGTRILPLHEVTFMVQEIFKFEFGFSIRDIGDPDAFPIADFPQRHPFPLITNQQTVADRAIRIVLDFQRDRNLMHSKYEPQ